MTCKETQRLIQCYVDDELDTSSALRVESHLNSCASCQQLLKHYRALRATLKASTRYYQSPLTLEKNIRAALSKIHPPTWRTWMIEWRWSTMTVAVFVVSLGVLLLWLTPVQKNDLAHEVVSAHVRSLLVDHLTDVASTNRHTVKPWFVGKLDFAPPIFDLTAQDFLLLGGRLDYLDHRPVAVLIYRHRQHRINLFIWPAQKKNFATLKSYSLQGFPIFHWADASMQYWAISDLNNNELQNFVNFLKAVPQSKSF